MVVKIIVFSILYLAGPSWEQSIEWVDPYKIYGMYYQPGLIQKRDAIILYGQIDLGQTTGFDRVHYEIKKHNMAYQTLCYLYLTKCEGYKNSFCYCKPSSANVIDVVINITADTSLSEAKVIGAMDTFEKKINSSEKSIPKIYDGTNIQVNMYVNGKIGNASSCHMEITGNDVCIAIEIPDIVNLQYQLVLKNVKTNMVLRNESKSFFYSTQVMDTLQLAVYFQVYDLPNSQQQFQCFIRAQSPDEGDNSFSVLFGFTLAILLIILLLILVSFLNRKRIIAYIESRQITFPRYGINKENENVQNVEEGERLVSFQEQKDEFAVVMTSSKSTVSSDDGVMIPEHIMAKIKEVKKRKENNKNVFKENVGKYFRRLRDSKDNCIIDFAKCQLETMVTVDVNVVSDRRPKTWHRTKIPYPFYDKRQWNRHGLGRIINVTKFTNCNKQGKHLWKWKQSPSSLFSKSESSSREWVEVLVYVSRHLVFDDIEAKHTSCKFIINDDLPKTLKFEGAIVRMANIEENWTLLTFLSKDLSIFGKVQENLTNFNQKWTGLDINNVISFIFNSRENYFKTINFGNMFDMFSDDKTLSFFLNIYSKKPNMAIFFERANATLMQMYQMKSNLDNDLESSHENIKLELSSMPFIIKDVQKNKNDTKTKEMEVGHI